MPDTPAQQSTPQHEVARAVVPVTGDFTAFERQFGEVADRIEARIKKIAESMKSAMEQFKDFAAGGGGPAGPGGATSPGSPGNAPPPPAVSSGPASQAAQPAPQIDLTPVTEKLARIAQGVDALQVVPGSLKSIESYVSQLADKPAGA